MALVKITTNEGAFRSSDTERFAASLGKMTYAAEGFAESNIASKLTWVLFEQLPESAFLMAAGLPPAPLYLVEITTLRGALNEGGKQALGEQITPTLLTFESCPSTFDNAARIWVRFSEVSDGDLIVGGQTTSLQTLRALMAQAA